jgi:hypothetical protein
MSSLTSLHEESESAHPNRPIHWFTTGVISAPCHNMPVQLVELDNGRSRTHHDVYAIEQRDLLIIERRQHTPGQSDSPCCRTTMSGLQCAISAAPPCKEARFSTSAADGL